MKKGLLLILLLANLGVFAWYRWYVLPNRPAPPLAPPLSGQPLKLMSELTPAEKKVAAAASTASAPAAATVAAAPATTHVPAATTAGIAAAAAQVCVSYGPFPSADAANLGLSRLKLLGLTASSRSIPGKAKLGYWVYLPSFGSRKEAQAATDLLKRKGVTDIYVVPDEANRNAVSLGVFSQKDGAIQREKEIKKLGMHVQMAERFREEAKYWLDAKGVEQALPQADAFKDLGDEGSPVGRATSACSSG